MHDATILQNSGGEQSVQRNMHIDTLTETDSRCHIGKRTKMHVGRTHVRGTFPAGPLWALAADWVGSVTGEAP